MDAHGGIFFIHGFLSLHFVRPTNSCFEDS